MKGLSIPLIVFLALLAIFLLMQLTAEEHEKRIEKKYGMEVNSISPEESTGITFGKTAKGVGEMFKGFLEGLSKNASSVEITK